MIEILMPAVPGGKPNIIGKIMVKVGDEVSKDDVLCNVETGKGNREIKATKDSTVFSIHVSEGQEVKSQDVLIILSEGPSLNNIDTQVTFQIIMPVVPGSKPNIVGKIMVKVGDYVEKDQLLCNVETGKGNRQIKANHNAIVSSIPIEEGQAVKSKDVLMELLVEKSETDSKKEIDKIEKKDDEAPSEIKKDLAIIGAGPGGYVAAIYAAKRGLDVALIEKGQVGGTCLNVGCIPTKSLVQSAKSYENLEKLGVFGIDAEVNAKVDLKKVIKRKDDVKGTLVNGINFLLNKNGVTLIKGEADFVDKNTLKVGEKFVKAKNIIIATGSLPSVLNVPGHDIDGIMDSTDALEIKKTPTSMTIVGGGVIGMEFAFIYNSFGTKVHVVEYQDCLLPMFDRDAGDEIAGIAREKGINISVSSGVTQIRKSVEGSYIVDYKQDGVSKSSVSEKVLMTTGRRAFAGNLDLEKIGVEINQKTGSIKVDRHCKTSIDNIYAIGDVSNRLKLAHVASHEGMIVVDHILGEDRMLNDKNVPSVVFTDPEIASVGYSEDALKKQGLDYKVTKFDFVGNGKALAMDENRGFIKMMFSQKGEILGAVIIGPDASSLISSLTIAIQNKVSAEELVHTIFAHPTTSEVIHEAGLEFFGRGIHQ